MNAPNQTPGHFNLLARVLHWTMAVMILAMLFIGVAMVTSLELRPWLIDMHRPLGLLILVLALVRLRHRRRNPPPPLPDSLPTLQARIAGASHVALYALMFAMAATSNDAAMKALGRNTPIIFISGESESEEIIRAMKGRPIEFLWKPFQIQDLVDAIDRGLIVDGVNRKNFIQKNEIL